MTARQLWPHKKIEVCYTLADDIGEIAGQDDEVVLSSSEGHLAHTVLGNRSCTPGSHCVVWDLESDGIVNDQTGLSFCVGVLDATEGKVGWSVKVPVNISHRVEDGMRISNVVTCAYSPLKEGVVVLEVNGEVVHTATEDGAFDWIPSKSGMYLLTHRAGSHVFTRKVVCTNAADMSQLEIGWLNGPVSECLPNVCVTVTNIVIASSVTKIGDSAFSSCRELISVTIPSSVRNVGKGAFSDCAKLKSIVVDEENPCYKSINGLLMTKDGEKVVSGINGDVEIPSGARNIGEMAFYGCSGLTSVTIPSSVTSISSNTFYNCSGLTNVIIPSGVTSIGYRAFYGCSGLTCVTIPSSVTAIGTCAFYGCGGLTSVSIPSSVTTIGNGAFYGCTGLTDVTVPGWRCNIDSTDVTNLVVSEGSTIIYNGAFRGWVELKSVIIPSSVTSIGEYAFSGCSALTSMTIPSGVTSIGNNAFYGCNSITSIKLTDGTRRMDTFLPSLYGQITRVEITGGVEIVDDAFNGCTKLSSIAIPDSLTSIGASAFSGCVNLSSLSIPASVTNIGENAFKDCANVSDVVIPIAVAKRGGDSALWSNISRCGLRVLQCVGVQKGDFLMLDTIILGYLGDRNIEELIVPDGVTSIADGAFAGLGKLRAVSFPKTLIEISSSAFANAFVLDNVVIPDSVVTIGAGAFSNCTELATLTFGTGLKTVGVSAFQSAISLERVVFHDGLETLGASAFAGCSRLRSVSLPSSVDTIGADVFAGCANITGVMVPTHVRTLKDMFPSSYGKIESVVVASGETSIVGDMFASASAMRVLDIATTVTNVGAGAFSQLQIDKIELPPHLVKLGDYAFSGCSQISEIVLPDKLEYVGSGAFYNCTTLRTIVLPDSVTYLGGEAFSACGQLQSVTLSRKLRCLYERTFTGCASLKELVVPASVEVMASYLFAHPWFSENIGLAHIYFLGNAPSVNSATYYGVSEGLTNYVLKGSTGWYMEGSPTLPVNGWPKEGYSRPITFWTPNELTVTFEGNGGTPNESKVTETTDLVYALPTVEPKREGYRFAGWWTERFAGAQVKAVSRVTATKDHVLYAHWVAVPTDSKIALDTASGSVVTPLETSLDGTVTWSAKGLPTGMKIAAKDVTDKTYGKLEGGTLYGTPTKPGTYVVKVTAKSGKTTETFDIEVTVGNYVDETLPLQDAYGTYLVGAKVCLELGSEFAGCKASGFPAGLKFAAKETKDSTFGTVAAGTVYGVPTKACTNAVIFTKTVSEKNTAGKTVKTTHTASATFAVAATSAWAVGTFNGRLDDGSGSVTLTVATSGKISGKIITGGKTWSFSVNGYEEIEVESVGGGGERTDALEIVATAKNGKATALVRLAVREDGATGSLVGDDFDATLTLWRNEWKDKGATAKLAPFVGLYTVQLAGDETGYGYLSLTLDAKGNCKATGKLPDGTSASGTLPLVWQCEVENVGGGGDDGYPMAIWQLAPSAYKGGQVGGLLTWQDANDASGTIASTKKVTGEEIAWASRAPTATGEYGAGFVRTLSANGSYYNKLAALADYYQTALTFNADAPALDATVKTIGLGEKNKRVTTSEAAQIDASALDCWSALTISLNNKNVFAVDQKTTKPSQDKTTKAWSYTGANDAALTFGFTKTTGIFKGTFTCWYDYVSTTDNTKDPAKETVTHTSKKVSYEGIMVLGEDASGSSSGEALRGYYLWDRNGAYVDEKTGKTKTYKYKESRPVSFE